MPCNPGLSGGIPLGFEKLRRCTRRYSAQRDEFHLVKVDSRPCAVQIVRAFCDDCVTNTSTMFSLQKLLGKEDKFFDLLEASAEEGRGSVQALKKLVQAPEKTKSLDDFILSRRRDKAITAEISEALCTSFVTALEREDIEALSNSLYKIPKTVEKIGERILMAPQFLHGMDLGRQVEMLEKATDTVVNMLKELRKGVRLENIKQQNDRLQLIEGEADKLVLDLMRGLYTGQTEGVRLVFLKDLFELLEKVTDRCRDAGNVMTHIVLKNS